MRDPRVRTVVFYITGHGFGHASRVVEVINALVARDPDLRIIVKTTAAQWLLDLTIRRPYTYERVETDTGIVQIDSLRLDEEASVRRALAFMSTFDARVEREVEALERTRPDLVVADMPALGIAAGARLGTAVAAMGNFTWDWAYSPYRGSAPVVDAIAAAYAQADIAVRLPMWGGFGAFAQIVDVPFVARRSTREPSEVRRACGLPDDRRLVLSSFGGHGLAGLEASLAQLDGYTVIFTSLGERRLEHNVLTLDEQRLYADGFRYEDLVRAVDVVVTKPGYGIIAECLANETALLYTSRGHFIEYDVLVAAMPRFLRTAFIDHADLFAGRWQPHLERLLAQPAPNERPATDGADVAAKLLSEMIR